MRSRVERSRGLLERTMERFDALLAPAAAGEAPLGAHPVPHPYLYMIWTTLHVPSITLPVFRGPHGLPIGAQFVGRRYEDRKLLALARWAYGVLREA
jgi:Asp-tRNA(Asn)/Glu-tRNA(Gln) amidotransferase A subunit family amidase